MTTYLYSLPFKYVVAGVALLPILAFSIYVSFLVVPIVMREVAPLVVRAIVGD